MCLHKRYIKNRIASYKRGDFDKYMIQVQCNNCPECRKQRQNDWLVRSFFEMTRNDYKSMFFVTLDFDDEHLPYYNGYPCFDSECIKAFFKRLRYYVPQFRYLYSTDYGGLLHRPHYHLMFLFKKYVKWSDFFDAVRYCWIYGRYSRIDLLSSGSSIWDCCSYVCKYTTKDLSFASLPDERLWPNRYRSVCRASTHFGYSALEEGLITFDMLKDNKPVFLPIGKNGTLIPFQIPRYYEKLICEDAVYYPEFRRTEFFKNEFGRQLQEIRHNGEYVYLLDCLVSSLSENLHSSSCFNVFKSLYPQSPYCDMTWQEILTDCLAEGEDFINFLYVSPFLKRNKYFKLATCYGKYIDSRYTDLDWIDHLIDNSRFERYNECIHLFRLYNQELNYTKYIIESYSSLVNEKERLLNKIRNNPRLRKYLNKIGFDYSKLFDTDVVNFTINFEEYSKRLDTPAIKICKDADFVRKYSDFRMMRYYKLTS